MSLTLPLSKASFTAPIGVFCHDRPDHLKLTLEALERCEEFELCPVTIFCDGPRTENAQDRVDQTIEVAKAFGKRRGARVIVRPHNLCFGNLVNGVSSLCEEYGCAIVIEDDIVCAPDFLKFMREALYRYWDESKVFAINGSMFEGVHPKSASTFFMPISLATGWATFRRAWDQFEWRPEGVWEFLQDKSRRKRFEFNGRWRISDWLEKAMKGELACWDPQWAYQVFAKGALCLFPYRSLVWNTGLGCGMVANGEIAPTFHGRDRRFFFDLTIDDFKEPRLENWVFPENVCADVQAYKRMAYFFEMEKRYFRVKNGRNERWHRLVSPLQANWVKRFCSNEMGS